MCLASHANVCSRGQGGKRMSSTVASAQGLHRVGGAALGGRRDGPAPRSPRLLRQWSAPPNSHSHKVQVADGLLLVNHEKFPYRQPPKGPFSAGAAIYRLDDPFKPEQIAFWPSTGLGVHRIVWTGGRYAHFSATPAGFRARIWVVLHLPHPPR